LKGRWQRSRSWSAMAPGCNSANSKNYKATKNKIASKIFFNTHPTGKANKRAMSRVCKKAPNLCSNGIVGEKRSQQVCCASSCRKCGGWGCSSRGASQKCCIDEITRSGKKCAASSHVGCVLTGGGPQRAQPQPPQASVQVPKGGAKLELARLLTLAKQRGGTRILLRSGASGKYCCDYGEKVICDHTTAASHCVFTAVIAGPGKIGLKNKAGNYCADSRQGTMRRSVGIKCQSKYLRKWETFAMVRNAQKYIGLRGGRNNGKYDCVDDGDDVECRPFEQSANKPSPAISVEEA